MKLVNSSWKERDTALAGDTQPATDSNYATSGKYGTI